MPGTLVQTLARGVCSHGGQMTTAGTGARVLLLGQPAAKASDTHPIVGCPLNISGKPQPCVTGSQFTPAGRVFIDGQPALLNTSVGIGKSAEQAPQGPVAITATQTRVFGM
jgi:hypothetical protein